MDAGRRSSSKITHLHGNSRTARLERFIYYPVISDLVISASHGCHFYSLLCLAANESARAALEAKEESKTLPLRVQELLCSYVGFVSHSKPKSRSYRFR